MTSFSWIDPLTFVVGLCAVMALVAFLLGRRRRRPALPQALEKKVVVPAAPPFAPYWAAPLTPRLSEEERFRRYGGRLPAPSRIEEKRRDDDSQETVLSALPLVLLAADQPLPADPAPWHGDGGQSGGAGATGGWEPAPAPEPAATTCEGYTSCSCDSSPSVDTSPTSTDP
jgi:hypothetical protein